MRLIVPAFLCLPPPNPPVLPACSIFVSWLYRDVLRLSALVHCSCFRARARARSGGAVRPVPNLLSDRELEKVFNACSGAGGCVRAPVARAAPLRAALPRRFRLCVVAVAPKGVV